MTELERLQKNVVDTLATYEDAYIPYARAEDNWAYAEQELREYLKEQDNAK
tara:strand:+ start:381 stop:533 length:153 start_codon:yes stop_codon:yes gene_type:complete